MLVDKKLMNKMELIEKRYTNLRYDSIMQIPAEMWETYEHFTSEPSAAENAEWKPVTSGTPWGNNWRTAWFRGDVKIPSECNDKKVFIRANTGGETLFLADGSFKGVFDDNHPVVLLTQRGVEGQSHHVAFEAYAGHENPGAGVDREVVTPQEGCRTFHGIELLVEREDVSAFVFDLKVLRQIAGVLDENSLRRNKVMKGLSKVYEVVDSLPAEILEEEWRPKLAKARDIMAPLLQDKNGSTAPVFGVVGHSHIDTAWLWPIAETWRKCARTFSSVLNLMDQYPEFTFIQSAPYHTSVVRQRYPEIYDRIVERVKEGRWEPNGAMWVEPDCNIPSGESFVRQLLTGQNATREMFGYTSDTLWMPDVFGYSAALPQILKGCNVEFFCTTKLSWNDTNRFPYDTFVWKGIDGTPVISHFNYIHCWPDPETLTQQWNNVQHKDIQDRRLCAIGYGDGGGGPMAEMIEVSRRVEDVEGSPRTRYTTVGDFMKGIRDELTDLPEWSGELYLELHRGTLTSIAGIKRGNRKSEIALRNAEFLCTLAALKGLPYPSEELSEIWKKLLVNQFHDILPGSSIARVNDEAIRDFHACTSDAQKLSKNALTALSETAKESNPGVMVVNSLSWDRCGEVVLENAPEGCFAAGDDAVSSQWIEDVEGKQKLVVSETIVPALGSVVIPLAAGKPVLDSPFRVDENTIETPHSIVAFDKMGRIISFVDKASGRDVVKPGGAMNTFWIGEDVPAYWDNWDIDRDQQMKMHINDGLIKREVISDGPVQLRLRSHYKIGKSSSMIQDMVFHAHTPQVDFETMVNWSEKHMLLKAGFEVNVFTDTARHEIQYGYVERATHQNLSQDRARFEVCNHKWTDLSEGEFGVALLNDCKYGIGVAGSEMRLSLIKAGTRPDVRGDEGKHLFTYSILPHACGFSVESVIRPAYELNIPVVSVPVDGNQEGWKGIVDIDASNIIIESIKQAECGDGFILRFYDAGKIGRKVNITFHVPIEKVNETNLLEEKINELTLEKNKTSVYVRPFEIKTLWCR